MTVTSKIDEMSLVFSPENVDSLETWQKQARLIFRDIEDIMQFDTVFGEASKSGKGFAGYTTIYTYNADPVFLLQVCYNEEFPKMGVYIHFSGRAFGKYLSELDLLASEVIQKFKEIEDYHAGNAHISRIDVALDFIDEGLEAPEIYNNLVDEKERLVDKNNRKNRSKISAVVNDQRVNTIYVGSKKKNTRLLMRIYDKKLEQINKAHQASHYLIAKNCNDWIRFEASFRQNYARQIGEELSKLTTKEELSGFLFDIFCEKYRFYDSFREEYTNLTKVMLAYADGFADVLDSRQAQESSLEVSINYLCKGAGLMPSLAKIEAFYGQKGIKDFFEYLLEYYEMIYEIKQDTHYYIVNHTNDYQARKKYPWRELAEGEVNGQ